MEATMNNTKSIIELLEQALVLMEEETLSSRLIQEQLFHLYQLRELETKEAA
jgi:hypothetical protein